MTRRRLRSLWGSLLLFAAAATASAGEIGEETVTVGDWYEAAEICSQKFDGHLCRADAWVSACRTGRIKVWEPEWVGNVSQSLGGKSHSGFLALLMMPDCEGGRWDDPNASYAIRCCFDSR